MYIVQEFCDGGSLLQAFQASRFWTPAGSQARPKDTLHVVCLAANIAAGMSYL